MDATPTTMAAAHATATASRHIFRRSTLPIVPICAQLLRPQYFGRRTAFIATESLLSQHVAIHSSSPTLLVAGQSCRPQQALRDTEQQTPSVLLFVGISRRS
jgi:hypothetical protein